MECAQTPLFRAIKIVGSQRKLAMQLGVKFSRLNHWVNLGINIPAKYAMKIEILTEGQVLAEDLCRDCREEFGELKQADRKRVKKFQVKTGEVWDSSPIPLLSSNAELLANYLVNCPHEIIRNTFSLPEKFICDDLLWDKKVVRTTLQELVKAKYLKAEIDSGLLFVEPEMFHE